LTVTPPANHPPDARWRFSVLASPAGPRAETARASGVLIFRPPTVELIVSPPQRSARKSARYDVLIRNPFQISQTVRRDAGDRTGRLKLRWPEQSSDLTFEIPAGRTKTVPLDVSPVYRHQGKEPLTLGFSVATTPIRPPGIALLSQAQFVALPGRRLPDRRIALLSAVVVFGLLLLIDAIGWSAILIVAAPLIGGIIFRAWRWLLLYPVALAIGLQVAEPLNVSDAPVAAIESSAGDRLASWVRDVNAGTPDGIRDVITGDKSGDRPVVSRTAVRVNACESQGHDLVDCGTTEWSLVALAALFAFIGTVTAKLLHRTIFRK
jgi:hypothetical protein